jgi:outer membrane protein assembly factor BamE (lipoprotein component of BamABCDE complex)
MSGAKRVLVVLLAFAPAAFADSIFVCKGSDGKVVYRDFPCPPEAEATTFGDLKTSDAKSAKSAKPASEQYLRPGMSKSEVRSLLGDPTEVTQEEGVEGRVDTWSYGAGSKTLQFDATDHLVK